MSFLQVRASRSIELLAQRRRVENHMRAQSKAVKEQQAMFDDSTAQLHSTVEGWVTKISGYERLLGNAMSLKGIDICWREAQALKAKQDKQLQEQVEQLAEKVVDSCSALVAANRKFESEELKSFEGEWGAVLCVLYQQDGVEWHCPMSACNANITQLDCLTKITVMASSPVGSFQLNLEYGWH